MDERWRAGGGAGVRRCGLPPHCTPELSRHVGLGSCGLLAFLFTSRMAVLLWTGLLPPSAAHPAFLEKRATTARRPEVRPHRSRAPRREVRMPRGPLGPALQSREPIAMPEAQGREQTPLGRQHPPNAPAPSPWMGPPGRPLLLLPLQSSPTWCL